MSEELTLQAAKEMAQEERVDLRGMAKTFESTLVNLNGIAEDLPTQLACWQNLKDNLPHPDMISNDVTRQKFDAAWDELLALEGEKMESMELLVAHGGSCQGFLAAAKELVRKLGRTILKDSTDGKLAKYNPEDLKNEINLVKEYAAAFASHFQLWCQHDTGRRQRQSTLVSIEKMIPSAMVSNSGDEQTNAALEEFRNFQEHIKQQLDKKNADQHILELFKLELADLQKAIAEKEAMLQDLGNKRESEFTLEIDCQFFCGSLSSYYNRVLFLLCKALGTKESLRVQADALQKAQEGEFDAWRISGLGFRAWGLEFRAWGLGLKLPGV